MTQLPSKHVGTRRDPREEAREALHKTGAPVEREQPKWDRDFDAEKRLRDYNAEWQVQKEER